MSKPDDAKIERTLRKLAREAVENGDEVTIRVIRERTETKLGLEKDFLKGEAWREKGKEIIKAAFNEPDKSAEQPVEKAKQSAAKAQKKSGKGDEKDKTSASAKASKSTPKPPQKTAPQVNGVKRKASESESAAEAGASSKSSNSKASAQLPNKKTKIDAPVAAGAQAAPEKAASNSESEESSEEEGESESGSSESEEDGEVEDAPTATAAATTDRRQSTAAIPSKAYKPPSGFADVDASLLPSNNPFADGSLKGKQIWHISAPSNVPMSALSEIALSSISSGAAVLSHKDVSYVLNEDKTTGAETTALLTPSKDGYQRSSQKISRTLLLQQKIDLPNLSGLQASQMTGSNAAGDIAQAAVSTGRAQPKGLRMRFKPPGFGKGNPGRIGGESESEDDGVEGAAPSFQFPKTLGQHGVEMRQDGDVEMVDAAEVEAGKSEKKAKKKRKEKEGGEADAELPKTNGATKPSAATAVTNGDGAGKESKEEKKRRKEEKRAKKAREASV